MADYTGMRIEAGTRNSVQQSIFGVVFMLASIGFLWAVSQHGDGPHRMRVLEVREYTVEGPRVKGGRSTQHVRELLATSRLTPHAAQPPPVPAPAPAASVPAPQVPITVPQMVNGEEYDTVVHDQAVFHNPDRGDVVDVYVDPSRPGTGDLRGINPGQVVAALFAMVGAAIFATGLSRFLGLRVQRGRRGGAPAGDEVPDGPFS